MKKSLVLLSLLLLLGGCQTSKPIERSAGLDNTVFMNLWGTFSQCQSSTDLDAMRGIVQQLNHAANIPTSGKEFVLPLPERFNRLVSKRTPRLAVDPTAMATACTLYTGQVALNAGRNDVAADMFLSVIQRHLETEYAYYVGQARLGLAQLSAGPHVSIDPSPKIISD